MKKSTKFYNLTQFPQNLQNASEVRNKMKNYHNIQFKLYNIQPVHCHIVAFKK